MALSISKEKGLMRGHWTGHNGSSQEFAERTKLRILDDLHVLPDTPRRVDPGEGEDHVRYSGIQNALKSC